jgi:hypothetical protein
MAQADSITTAIRQLMSRGRPPRSTSPVQLAHTELVAALAGNLPHPIYGGASTAAPTIWRSCSRRCTPIWR